MAASSNQTENIQESWGEGAHRVEASAFICGKDIVVVIEGGTRYHIGAVSLAIPRLSLSDSARVSASASVLCVTGHKEDELARNISLQIASALNCVVTVVAGVHIDEANAMDISKILDNCTQVVSNLVERLKRI